VEESAPLKFDGTISLSLSNDSAQNLAAEKAQRLKLFLNIGKWKNLTIHSNK